MEDSYMSMALDNAERIRKSIAGGAAEQQPFLLFINFPLIKSVTGVDLHEYFNDPKTMMDAQIEVFSRLGLDGPLYPDYGVAAECSAMGSEIVYNDMGFPTVHGDAKMELEDLLARSKPADPWGGSLMTKALEALEYMVKNVPSDFRVENCGVVGPFTTAAQYRDIQEFCVDLYMEPELVHELLELSTETIIRFCREQQKILGRDLEHILIYDDASSFLNEENYRIFSMPYQEKLYSAFPGAERWLHNDAEALHLSELIAESGFCLWHTGKCFDITEARRRTQGKVSLCGNLPPLEELLKGTPEDVAAAVNRQLDVFDKDPKYILSTGGFISYGTPVENIQALIQTALAR